MESAGLPMRGDAAPHCTAASLGEALKVLSRSGLTLWVSSLLDPAGRSDGGAAGKRKGSGSGDRTGVFMQGKVAQQGVF